MRVPDVSKIEILGAQDEQIIVEFSTEKLAGLGIDRAALIAAIEAQNAVNPAGTLETGDEPSGFGFPAPSIPSRTLLQSTLLRTAACCA